MGKEKVTMADIQILVNHGVDKIIALKIFFNDFANEDVLALSFDDIRELYRLVQSIGDVPLAETLRSLLLQGYDFPQEIWLWGELKKHNDSFAGDFWKDIMSKITTAGQQQLAFRMIAEMSLPPSVKKRALDEIENVLKKSMQDIIKIQKEKKEQEKKSEQSA